MKRLRSTLILLVAGLALGAYIYFVESERKPASEAATERAKVFTVDASGMTELEVKASGGDRTHLKKEGGAWKIVAPIEVAADEAEVSAITSNLASLEVQRVVSEKPGDLAQFGLAAPKTEVAFRGAGDKEMRRLLIGDKTATGGDLYARLADQPRVFLISGYLDSTFNRSTFDLRNKTILHFERDKVTGVEIAGGGRHLVFAKDGDTWRLTEPMAARADFGAVEGLIGRLNTGQMKAIVADAPADLEPYGLGRPEYTVTLVAGSARSSLAFGGKSPEGTVYAKDAARPMVFTVESFLTDDLKKGPDDFRPKDIFEFRTYTGSRFEITRGADTIVFEKRKGKEASEPERWAQAQPAREADVAKIEDFLSNISNLRAQGFVDALPAGAAEAARAKAVFGEARKDETVTFYRAGSDVFAVRPGDPGAARLTASDFDSAMKALEAVK